MATVAEKVEKADEFNRLVRVCAEAGYGAVNAYRSSFGGVRLVPWERASAVSWQMAVHGVLQGGEATHVSLTQTEHDLFVDVVRVTAKAMGWREVSS